MRLWPRRKRKHEKVTEREIKQSERELKEAQARLKMLDVLVEVVEYGKPKTHRDAE